ncbi:LacI family DNA-binding transcriptional regulator [Ruania alba]|uniref:DNA-binding transcriptional regulator, LacI/PurR family n=1 Tax=Ruania alba TaxID=648782 RepID=A0A1H5N7S8_9MICO|nr:LacI family DNA-binding transcriptional regulator [Ruania alba]SEE97672.1 DNA-binding transcriptional regulator, LacI/PurR family [Ruania alba]
MTTTRHESGRRSGSSRRPTQADVARLAGVSQTTVSLVLSGSGAAQRRVGEEVSERVLRAIELTGYVANPVAQSLAGGRTSIIGVYTYEPVFPHDAGNFYYPFLEGMEDEAQRLGVDLLLFTSMAPSHRGLTGGSGIRRLRVADGCVLLGRHSSPDDLAELVRQEFPFAFVGRRETPAGEVPFAGAAYQDATASVVEHLLELGHRRIALVNEYTGHESVEDRARGYRRAMAAAGLQPVTFDQGDRDAGDLLDALRASGMTAAAVSSDVVGRLRRAALDRGLTVPGDLSLARLGDPEIREDADVDWTGFLIPRMQMGAEALRIVARRLAGDEDTDAQVFIPCTLVDGSTAGPLAPSA